MTLLLRYCTFKSSHCNSFEDRAPVDSIYGCPIIKWVAETWPHDNSQGTTIVAPKMSDSDMSHYVIAPWHHRISPNHIDTTNAIPSTASSTFITGFNCMSVTDRITKRVNANMPSESLLSGMTDLKLSSRYRTHCFSAWMSWRRIPGPTNALVLDEGRTLCNIVYPVMLRRRRETLLIRPHHWPRVSGVPVADCQKASTSQTHFSISNYSENDQRIAGVNKLIKHSNSWKPKNIVPNFDVISHRWLLV